MRIYEDPLKTSQNRLPERSYYIQMGPYDTIDLCGTWDFWFYKRDVDVPEVFES